MLETAFGPSGSPLLAFNNPQMGLGNDIYSFLAPVQITLEADDTYRVGVRASFPTVTGRFFWSGSHAGSTPVENFASYEGYRWEVGGLPTTVDSNNYGFQINGVTAVPEPSSFAMLGAVFGFAAIGRWKYRLRRDAKNIKENADGVV